MDVRLFIAGADEKTCISLFYKWLDGETKSALNDSLARIYPLFMPLGVEYPELALRKMRARWGSCAVNEGKITLNKRLIHVPQECIDYVSAHELAHFWSLITAQIFIACWIMCVPHGAWSGKN